PGILAYGLGGERDVDFVKTIGFLADAFDPPHDVGADELVIHRGERHFDALLVGDGERTRLNRACIAIYAIDGCETAQSSVLCPPSRVVRLRSRCHPAQAAATMAMPAIPTT